MASPVTRSRESAVRTRWHKRLLIVLGLLGAGSFIWSQLPEGSYSTDLSRIGDGRPAVVLTQDPNFLGGAEVMELLNAIRADYDGEMAFKVAHLASPRARDFAGRHGASDGTVLVFAANGDPVGVLHQPRSTEALRLVLDSALGR